MKISTLLISGLLIFGTSSAMAAPVNIMVGDDDGYGQGIADGVDLPSIALPSDWRDASEAAATNGAQQTDFYSANFTPLAETFDVIFDLASLSLTSASFIVDMAGFQVSTWGPLSVAYNGVDQAGLFDFDDGAFGTAVRSFSLDAAAMAAANAAGEFVVTIARNDSNDGIGFDYFQLRGEGTSAVPEPSILALFGLGLLGLGFARRKVRS